MRGAVAAVVLAGVTLVAGCAGEEPPPLASNDPPAANDDTDRDEDRDEGGPETPPDDDGDVTDGAGGGPGTLRSAMIRDPLRNRSDNFEVTELGEASLDFVDGAYRMVSPGGPLLSPLLAPELADAAETDVEVTVSARDGRGLVGVACGVTRENAYLMVAGLREDGARYFAIAHLDLTRGDQTPLRDSNLDDTADPDAVVPETGPFTIGATCLPGDTDDEARLTMRIDGEEVAAVRADLGTPTGQPGVFAQGLQADPFVVDLNDFVVSGAPA